jgi:hypothetical protein
VERYENGMNEIDNDILSIDDINIEKQHIEYNSLDNEQLLKLVFGYVQYNVTVPNEVKSLCIDKDIWSIVEPMIGINDVEEIMEEIDSAMY